MTDAFRRRRPLSVPDFIRFVFRFLLSTWRFALFFFNVASNLFEALILFYITLSYYTLHYSGFGTIGK